MTAYVLSRVTKLAKKYFSFLFVRISIAFDITLAVFSRVILTISLNLIYKLDFQLRIFA